MNKTPKQARRIKLITALSSYMFVWQAVKMWNGNRQRTVSRVHKVTCLAKLRGCLGYGRCSHFRYPHPINAADCQMSRAPSCDVYAVLFCCSRLTHKSTASGMLIFYEQPLSNELHCCRRTRGMRVKMYPVRWLESSAENVDSSRI
jgi:hypothetical protein